MSLSYDNHLCLKQGERYTVTIWSSPETIHHLSDSPVYKGQYESRYGYGGMGYHHCEDNESDVQIADIFFLLTNQNLLIFGHTLAVLCASVVWVRQQAQTETKDILVFAEDG